jgi:hypothetical protein
MTNKTNTRPVDPSKKFAIIIAIESYRKGLSNVKYAGADAAKFKEVLITQFGFLEGEIEVLLNEYAVKAALENDVPYWIRQLSPDHQFIFYYVGHGFYKNGNNMLTCWDTSLYNVEGTSVSISDVILEPLKISGCRRSLIFLDTCAVELKDLLDSRDLVSDMSASKLEEFTSLSEYNAVFMSCSPGEKSYSCDILKQGIWTHHLTEALAGKTEDAIVKDILITANSLQAYLSDAVPKYVAKTKIGGGIQRPFAKLNAQNDFLVRRLTVPTRHFDKSLPNFRLNYQKAIFRKIDEKRIKDGSGFKEGWKPPRWRNRKAIEFVQTVFEPDIQTEVQKVYEKTKKILGLRKAEVKYSTHSEGGYVECPLFQYYVDVTLHEDDLAKAKFMRTLEIRVSRNELPDDFDSIFPIYLDELVIPIEGDLDFDDIVNKFENLVESQGGTLKDNQSTETMEYITSNGTSITINVLEKQLIITHYSPMRTLDLADKSIDDLRRISNHKINLLGTL